MTGRKKIRDAILGISDKKIESTDMCYRFSHVEGGDALEDKRRKQILKWGGFGQDEIVVCAYETGAFGSVKKVLSSRKTPFGRMAPSMLPKRTVSISIPCVMPTSAMYSGAQRTAASSPLYWPMQRSGSMPASMASSVQKH